MSMQYCKFCSIAVDTDADVDHFNASGKCVTSDRIDTYLGILVAIEHEQRFALFQKEGPDGLEPAPVEVTEDCRVCGIRLHPETMVVALVDANDKPVTLFCSWECADDFQHGATSGADRTIKNKKTYPNNGDNDYSKIGRR